MSNHTLQEIFCNRCGDQSLAESRFCESCGDPFDCPFCSCGAELVPKANFCHMCGARVILAEPPKTNPEEDTDKQPPRQEEPSDRATLQIVDMSNQLRALHQKLIEVHHKTAAILQEEKRLKLLTDESQKKAQVHREKAVEAAQGGHQAEAQRALEQQLIHEKEATEHRARWELTKISCEPLRGELFTLHNQFLAFVDVSLERFAYLQGWTQAEAVFRDCLGVEVSSSRKARILYAIGIVARDGLGDIERAKVAFEQSALADPKLLQAREALKTLF
jgi:hypothetical protein